MEKGSKHTEDVKKRISEALEGNSNAEKWTEDLVCDILNAMWDFARTGKKVNIKRTKSSKGGCEKPYTFKKKETIKRNIHLKSTLLIAFDIKNPDWFNQMGKKFKNNETVSRLLSCISMICENNTYNDAANNATNAIVAKMHLSTHYGWADKSEVQQEIDLLSNIEILEDDGEEGETKNKD